MPAKQTQIVLAPHELGFSWLDGEREAFATAVWDPELIAPGKYLDTLRDGGWAPKSPITEWTHEQWLSLNTDFECALRMIHGPEELSLAMIEHYLTAYAHYPYRYLCEAVARYELRAYPHVLVQAKAHPDTALAAYGPFDSSELAPFVAGVAHKKKLKPAAEAWLLRHAQAAAIGLLPDALTGVGKPKKAAVAALQLLREHGHADMIDSLC